MADHLAVETIETMKANATRDDEPWQLDKASFVTLCDMALSTAREHRHYLDASRMASAHRQRVAQLERAFDSAIDFIEAWSNWWSYALEKPDGSDPTAEDDRMAHELGDRASKTVIEGRRLLKAKP